MSTFKPRYSRRQFLQQLAVTGLSVVAIPVPGSDNVIARRKTVTRIIPSTGESVPVIGMGSWLTFDVGDDLAARSARLKVLQTFFDQGGAVIDSSPMYGSSQEVIGYCLERIQNKSKLFAATKVWIYGKKLGEMQMRSARKLWNVAKFDLMQIHNMLDWQSHLETLKTMKAEGRIRYIGITTSHGRRHKELEQALLKESFDFVQLTYNLLDREVEQRLLPIAKEKGIAVIANRPFQRGGLFDYVAGKPLPVWAAEYECRNWAQFFLKFIVSHPAVTCAIPATSRVDHMLENMGAGYGRLPDGKFRARMAQYMNDI
jgi:diketogulonate reductase-like aldo/keto reductase